MSKKHSPSPIAEAERILEQRRRVTPAQLVALIRAINPTPRELRGEAATYRYRLKSQLQSLLMRDYGADVEVLAAADERGVVALRHRYLADGDACHAVVAALDEDVRVAVQLELDTRSAADPPRSPAIARKSLPPDRGMAGPDTAPQSDDTSDAETLLGRGRDALAAYDYDAARRCFERAVHFSRGSTACGVALLELLVDHLAADEDALAVEHTLAAETVMQREIRGLLALAAARAGQREQAMSWLRGLVGERAATAWGILAEAALATDDFAAAEPCVAAAAEALAATHPAVVSLRARLAERRQAARQPLEDALLETFTAGHLSAAEAAAQAQALLQQWPDSAVAGRVLRELTTKAREDQGRAHLDAARHALAGGELGVARARCVKARAAGIDTTTVEQQIAAHEAAQQQAQERALADECLARLSAEEAQAGLQHYCRLSSAVRALIREASGRAALDWLEALAAPERNRERLSIVSAVLALEEIHAAAEPILHAASDGDSARAGQADASRCLAVLDAHARVLERLPEAIRLREAAQQVIQRERQAQARRLLDLVEQSLALPARDFAQAAAHLQSCDRKVLDAADRTRAERLATQLDQHTQSERHRQRYQTLLAAGSLLAARAELDSLLAHHAAAVAGDNSRGKRAAEEEARPAVPGEGEREGSPLNDAAQADLAEHNDLVQQRSALGQQIQRQFAVVDVHLDPAAPESQPPLKLPWTFRVKSETCPAALDRAGSSITLAAAYGRHAFVEILDLACGRVVRRLCLKTEHPLGAVDVYRDLEAEGTLLLVGDHGLVELSAESGEILRYISLAAFVDERDDEREVIPSSGDYLWLLTTDRLGEDHTRIIDLRSGSVRRDLAMGGHGAPIWGMTPPTVAIRDILLEHPPKLYHPSGALADLPEPPPLDIRGWTVHPSQTRLLMLIQDGSDDDREAVESSARLCVLGAPGAAHGLLPDTNLDYVWQLATSRARELVYFLSHSSVEGSMRLRAQRFDEGKLEPVFDTHLPEDALLVRDAASRHVALSWSSADTGAQAMLLGDHPPTIAAQPRTRRIFRLPSLDGHGICNAGEPSEELQDKLRPFTRVDRFDSSQRAATAMVLAERYAGEPAVLTKLLSWLRPEELSQPLRAIMERQLADHPPLATRLAHIAASIGDWPQVQALLGDLDLVSLPHSFREHTAHLLGLARLHGGAALDQVRQIWEQGLAHSREALMSCDLHSCLVYLDALGRASQLGSQSDEVDLYAGECVVRVLWILARAHRLRAEGDLAGACAVLERPRVHTPDELQWLAHLADVHLHLPPPTDALGRYRKTRALAEFLALLEQPRSSYTNLPLPGVSWDDARIAEVAAHARAWLDTAEPL